MGIIRDSFVVLKTWAEAIDALPEEYQLETYKALTKYGLYGVIPQNLSPVVNAMLISFSKGMENNIARYKASVENGKMGGRPKKETQQNLEKPSETQQNQSEPTQNLNVNDNVNDIKLVNNNLNIFENYNTPCAYARVRERSNKERQPFVDYYKEFFDYCFADKFKNSAFEVIDTILEAKEQSSTEKGLVFNHKTYNSKEFVQLIANIDCDMFRSIVIQLTYKEDIESRPFYILGCVLKSSEKKGSKMTREEMEHFIEENGDRI